MLDLYWNTVNKATRTLYIFSLLFMLINPKWSTLILFTIVSFWSRLPGMGTPVYGSWLLMFDMVDFFSVIVAINQGGGKAVVFSIIVNLISRVMGEHANWLWVLKDTISVAIVCSIMPYLYLLTQNIGTLMILFTLARTVVIIILQPIMPVYPNHIFVFASFVWTGSQYLINLFYGRMFGSFFDGLLRSGVNFSWTLFFIVSSVIFGFKTYRKYFSDSNNKIFKRTLDISEQYRVY